MNSKRGWRIEKFYFVLLDPLTLSVYIAIQVETWMNKMVLGSGGFTHCQPIGRLILCRSSLYYCWFAAIVRNRTPTTLMDILPPECMYDNLWHEIRYEKLSAIINFFYVPKIFFLFSYLIKIVEKNNATQDEVLIS